ncbi:MAG: hypothetical protein Q7K55_03300 [Candidatus Levybacteria bacterium]|nr:hypothetical protein [Candidatus Levybacteria bacterium]
MKDRNDQEEQLPTVVEILQKLAKYGTVLEYPEKPIIFESSPQSAVKTLAVKICSTETLNTEALHKLHTQTRLV